MKSALIIAAIMCILGGLGAAMAWMGLIVLTVPKLLPHEAERMWRLFWAVGITEVIGLIISIAFLFARRPGHAAIAGALTIAGFFVFGLWESLA